MPAADEHELAGEVKRKHSRGPPGPQRGTLVLPRTVGMRCSSPEMQQAAPDSLYEGMNTRSSPDRCST